MAKLRSKDTPFTIIDNIKGGGGSRKERFWRDKHAFNQVLDLSSKFRNRIKDLPKTWKVKISNEDEISKTYGFRGFQFGNWVSTEDRYNYLMGLHLCCIDLNSILKFKNNLGLGGELGISVGARGSSPALAHFEPSRYIINLTLYKDEVFNPFTGLKLDWDKTRRFLQTGGIGSFAHEYGHFLDFVLGGYYDQSAKSWALSGGSSTSTKRLNNVLKLKMRTLMDSVLESALWVDFLKGKPTGLQTRLEKADKGKSSPYFTQRTEIFARLFEQYIQQKLLDQHVQNRFLHKPIYKNAVYCTPSEYKRVAPYMDKLISEMRKYF